MHFNLPEGRIMVYETIRGQGHPDFILCSPRDPTKLISAVCGLYFRALPDVKMIAYEYTTELGKDMSNHLNFVATFAQTALALGVQDVSTLTVPNLNHGCLTEGPEDLVTEEISLLYPVEQSLHLSLRICLVYT